RAPPLTKAQGLIICLSGKSEARSIVSIELGLWVKSGYVDLISVRFTHRRGRSARLRNIQLSAKSGRAIFHIPLTVSPEAAGRNIVGNRDLAILRSSRLFCRSDQAARRP